jgi:hypothetical protein
MAGTVLGGVEMSQTSEKHKTHVGDVVETNGRGVGRSGRMGEILEVLGEPGHEHFRVRWEDGRESVFYPAGEATIRPKPTRSRKTAGKRS